MKVWNPNQKHFEAAPPFPEFVGGWRTEEEGRPSPSLLRRIARGVLGSARLAIETLHPGIGRLEALLEGATASDPRISPVQAVPPIPPIAATTWTTLVPRVPIVDRPARRAMLPMSSGCNIRPGAPHTVASRPQISMFGPERIVISGDPDRWLIHDIKVGRRSQFSDEGTLPGAVFAPGAEDAEVRLDIVPTGGKFAITVEYVGPEPDGEPFQCTAIGAAVDSLDPVEPRRIYLPVSSGVRILPSTGAQITATQQDIAFRPERIILGGRPDRWVINNILVGQRSQLAQAGDVPGQAFAATFRGSMTSFDTVQTGMDFRIIATYVGTEAEGEPFLACAIGTVAS